MAVTSAATAVMNVAGGPSGARAFKTPVTLRQASRHRLTRIGYTECTASVPVIHTTSVRVRLAGHLAS
jgi:hypothetical protein